jgi:predicted transglutaminase-like cysteine proteinase
MMLAALLMAQAAPVDPAPVPEPAAAAALAMPDATPAVVTIPYSWLEYCWRSKDPGCAVTSVSAREVAYVNKLVAHTIVQFGDPTPLDPWVAFPPDRTGDCDDHTVTVRAALMALGVPARAMRIELGRVIEQDGRTAGHAVLVVTIAGVEWVADRRTPDILYRADDRPYTWTPLATQPRDAVIWETTQ